MADESTTGEGGPIRVEVAHARPENQVLLSFEAEPGITARQAVERSGILEQFPDIDLMGENKLGVFGKLVKPDQPLRDGDRVEIYRPLIADPKEVRRQRAKQKKGKEDSAEEGGGEEA
ncbi:MAG: RnfH family protein [Thiohalospira sp.]|uniref:RnfH family protein n=1 Tax=Thiohalospira sp. TaxID=3080549 RepID=UPI00397F30AF